MTRARGRPDGNRSVHPLRRLADEILPYLRELDDREWTPEEREFIADMERLRGTAADGAGEADGVPGASPGRAGQRGREGEFLGADTRAGG